jgi:hypothetical protein
MSVQVSTDSQRSRSTHPSPATAWRQAGSPSVRADSTTDTVYPFVLHVGYQDTVDVPMTAAGLRSLRDSLTALLAATSPVEPEDFVAAWAQTHGAVVHDAPRRLPHDEPVVRAGAEVVPLNRRQVQRHFAAA